MWIQHPHHAPCLVVGLNPVFNQSVGRETGSESSQARSVAGNLRERGGELIGTREESGSSCPHSLILDSMLSILNTRLTDWASKTSDLSICLKKYR